MTEEVRGQQEPGLHEEHLHLSSARAVLDFRPTEVPCDKPALFVVANSGPMGAPLTTGTAQIQRQLLEGRGKAFVQVLPV